jgi:nucleoid DNA-binding protein
MTKSDLINKVQEKFKIYTNKDIAYAFKNYKTVNNIPALIVMMNFNYF